jgi:hypothetical protein
MSSQFRDLSTGDGAQRALPNNGTVIVAAHPRGAGFRVLSRMARHRTAEENFVPRHRLDAEPDCVKSA